MRVIEKASARVCLAYETLQSRTPGEKLYVSYSGGKDSECIAEICLRAVGSAAVEINYNATGIDPPEVVKHIKARFATWETLGIECHFNKPEANMHDLIVAKGPPTRTKRYCCEKLKEGKGAGRVVITGVRWAESARRAASHDVLTIFSKDKSKRVAYHNDNDVRRRILEQCTTRSRITVNPIVDWADTDVWDFIKGERIPYCRLYDEGFHGSVVLAARWLAERDTPNSNGGHTWSITTGEPLPISSKPLQYGDVLGWRTVDDLWHWWLEDGVVPGQIGITEGGVGVKEDFECGWLSDEYWERLAEAMIALADHDDEGRPVNHMDEAAVREYCARTGMPLPDGIDPAPEKRSKMGNVPTVVDGKRYASKREAARHGELQLMQKAGEIRGFAEQVRFILADRVAYVADFVVLMNDGTYVVEDAKGFRTDVYKIKKKLMRAVHGIEIREV